MIEACLILDIYLLLDVIFGMREHKYFKEFISVLDANFILLFW